MKEDFKFPVFWERISSIFHIPGALLLFLLLWFSTCPIPVADLWWQLKSGQVILENRQIPPTDIFSWTAGNLPWINHEWLPESVFYIIYRSGDFFALYIFKVLIIAISFFILIFYVFKTGRDSHFPFISAILLLLVSGGQLYFDIRPYLFTYLFLAITLFILLFSLHFPIPRPSFLFLLLPITLLWVNSHGGYILIYVLTFLFIGDYLLKGFQLKIKTGEKVIPLWLILELLLFIGAGIGMLTGKGFYKEILGTFSIQQLVGFFMIGAGIYIFIKRSEKKPMADSAVSSGEAVAVSPGGSSSVSRPPGFLLGVFPLILLAGLVNPYGFEIFSYPFTFFGDSYYRRNLIEWIPPDLTGSHVDFLLTFIFVLLLFILFAGRLRTWDIILFCCFSYLALTVVRHRVLFSLVMIPTLSYLLESLWERIKKAMKGKGEGVFEARWFRILNRFFFFLILIYTFYYGLTLSWGDLNMEKKLFPVAGVEFLKKNPLPGKMYNPYEWGGYFIWKLYPDYPVFIDGRANTLYPEPFYKEAMETLWGEECWEEVLNKYDVNFVFCNKYLWGAGSQKLPYRLMNSKNWVLIFEDDIELLFIRNSEANQEIIRKARQGELILPETPFQWNIQAQELILKKDFKGAEEILNKILQEEPENISALMKFAYIRLITGEGESAEKYLYRILEINPQTSMAHFNLGLLYENRKNYSKALYHYEQELKNNPKNSGATQGIKRIKNLPVPED